MHDDGRQERKLADVGIRHVCEVHEQDVFRAIEERFDRDAVARHEEKCNVGGIVGSRVADQRSGAARNEGFDEFCLLASGRVVLGYAVCVQEHPDDVGSPAVPSADQDSLAFEIAQAFPGRDLAAVVYPQGLIEHAPERA